MSSKKGVPSHTEVFEEFRTRNSNACKMTGALRFVIFALVCAYAHAQCCAGMFSGMDGKDAVQPKDEAACKAAKTMTGSSGGTWTATCASGTSCLALKCTGKQGTTAVNALIPSCNTDAVLTASIDSMQKGLAAIGATEVKCISGAPSSKFASGALLMVSAFVSVVVASV